MCFVMNDGLSESRWNWPFSLVQMVRCSFACLEGGDNCSLLAPHTKYGIRASCILCWLMLISAAVIYIAYICWSISTSDTEFPNVFWSTSNSHTLSYWVWFDYYKKFCLTISKAKTSPMFPPRCATAKYHQIIWAVKSDAGTFATFQNVGKARKRG